MPIEPYLMFNGCCEEAIAFYRQALGAEVVMLMRYRESPDPPPPGMLPAGSDDKVMHATLRIGDANLMCSDGLNSGTREFKGISLSHTLPDEAAARRTFDALGAGGHVDMPIGRTFWSPCFGMLTDKFGVSWMISVPGVA